MSASDAVGFHFGSGSELGFLACEGGWQFAGKKLNHCRVNLIGEARPAGLPGTDVLAVVQNHYCHIKFHIEGDYSGVTSGAAVIPETANCGQDEIGVSIMPR